ncbi:MAG: hypothetical protein JW730_07800 [Anaerolineales bacterium]|nr:hypothetical protein [Anaerolineales bacterium]
MTTSSGQYVGIDVAKDRLDVAVLGRGGRANPELVQEWGDWCPDKQVGL